VSNRPILFHRLATQDYLVALRWYAERSGWAAQRFREAVGKTLERIAQNPEQGTIYRERFRWLRLRTFPYVIYYEMRAAESVRILAVAHGKRRPGYWLRRRGP
jgi:plasmid stabilization system protein ParE